MKRIILINRYFYPDISATSQLLGDLAFELTTSDYEIFVITSRLRYDDSNALLPPREKIRGINIFRVWTTRFGRRILAGRAIDYITFYYSVWWRLLILLRSSDLVVVKTDPPLMSVLAAFVTRLKGAKQVNWLQDLFPEVAVELNITGLKMFSPALRALRNYSLRFATSNVVIGDLMARRVQSENIDQNKITVIHNWSDAAEIYPLTSEENYLKTEWGLNDKFVIGYSGNLGRAHEFETIMNAASLLEREKNIIFLFIGGGSQYQRLKERAEQSCAKNIIFKQYQTRDKLRYSLSIPDVHLVTLRPSLEGLIVPSKFYGIIAAGRPIVYIGKKSGEIPNILEKTNCGVTVTPGEAKKLCDQIYEFYENPGLTKTAGKNARVMFEEKFDKSIALNNWRQLLEKAFGR